MTRSQYALLTILALLVGCDQAISDDDRTMVDQCTRHSIFMKCVKALPQGPKETKYNDWDEVIGKCGTIAYYQSLRKGKFIKPECMVDR